MAKKDNWMWSRPAPAWITYDELVRQMKEHGYHETWRNQLNSGVHHMWFLPRKGTISDRYLVDAHSNITSLAFVFEPEGQNHMAALMGGRVMGISIPLSFTLADLATAPDDVHRVGCLALALGERQAAWRGQRVQAVWLPYRLACAVTGLLRCQVQRAARRLEATQQTIMAA